MTDWIKEKYKPLLEDLSYREIVHTAVDAIITIDEKARILTVNPAVLSMFQYEEKELIGNNVKLIMPNPHREQHDQYINNYLNSGKKKIIGLGREVHGMRKDGSLFPCRLSVSQVVLDNGGRIFTGIIHDTTEVKHAKSELKALNQELEQRVNQRTQELENAVNQLLGMNKELEKEINHRIRIETKLKEREEQLEALLDNEKELNSLKSRFVSMASHEFKTPLSTVMSSASIIGKYQTTDDQSKRQKHVVRIKESVAHLNNILNDFLSLTRVEEGKIPLKLSQVNIKDETMTVIEELSGQCSMNQKLIFENQFNFDKVLMDRAIYRNILYNLVSNAIKYSQEDVKISIGQADSKIELIISDNGIGIPEADKKYLFTRFFRASNALNTKGTGLGLHIIQTYVEILKGSIHFESKENEGSSFFLYLPIVHDANFYNV